MRRLGEFASTHLSRMTQVHTATFVLISYLLSMASLLWVQLLLALEEIMYFLWALIIGLLVGAVAKLVMPGKDPGGILTTSLIGVAGSFLATFLGHALGWYERGQAAGFIASVIGAILLLSIYRTFRNRTAQRS